MQHIFNEEKDDLEKSFADIKKILDNRTFKYEVLISFWLSIHLQKLESAKLSMIIYFSLFQHYSIRLGSNY